MSPAAGPRRLGQILGMNVISASGTSLGKVNDVRVRASSGTVGYGGLVVDGLVVTQRDTGSLLGYDRRRQQGPAVIRLLIARLHRNAGYIPWPSVRTVDWEQRRVLVSVEAMASLEEP